MPITINNNNLTLENNKIDATYTELFGKLNVAKAWTNTQTTSAGGTAVVLVGDGDILTTMECEDINKCKGGLFDASIKSMSVCIISGKIYKYLSGNLIQLGTKSDYDKISSSANNTKIVYAIDTDGKLWYINDTTETQIGTDTTWNLLSNVYNNTCFGINNGEAYLLNGTSTPSRIFNDYSNITSILRTNSYNYFINAGYLYYSNDNMTSINLIGTDNNWVSLIESPHSAAVINSDKKLYTIDINNLYDSGLTNVIKAVGSPYNWYFALTSDGKIYSLKGNNPATCVDRSNEKIWSDISCYYSDSNTGWNITLCVFGISEGKLYSINGTTYTQIGVISNYQKIIGMPYSLAITWTGDATSVLHTVYTTKSPQTNDKAYKDEDLTIYSTIQSTGVGTITDEYRTYDRDVTKDTSFTAIPPATMHETMSTIDFLRITNPNT